jgi:hypothetical protein
MFITQLRPRSGSALLVACILSKNLVAVLTFSLILPGQDKSVDDRAENNKDRASKRSFCGHLIMH